MPGNYCFNMYTYLLIRINSCCRNCNNGECNYHFVFLQMVDTLLQLHANCSVTWNKNIVAILQRLYVQDCDTYSANIALSVSSFCICRRELVLFPADGRSGKFSASFARSARNLSNSGKAKLS